MPTNICTHINILHLKFLYKAMLMMMIMSTISHRNLQELDMKSSLLINIPFSCFLESRWIELWLLVILYVVSSLLWYFFKNKIQFSSWPILGNLPTLIKNAHCVNHILLDSFSTYGPSFKLIGPSFSQINYFITCHPNNIEYILKTNFSNFPKGQDFYEIFDIFGDGIFSTDFEPWLQQRKMLHTRLISKEFKAFVSKVNKSEIEEALLPLLLQLSNENGTSTVFDLQSVFLRLTYDTSFSMTFGVNPKSLSMDFPNNEVANAIEVVTETIFYRHIVPDIWWKFSRLLGVGQEKRNAKARIVIDDSLGELISLKKKEMLQGVGSTSYDLLSAFMLENDSKTADHQGKNTTTTAAGIDHNGLSFRSDKFLRDTALILFFAAADTSASGLTWFFWSICKNPQVEAKIMEELRQLVSNGDDDHHLREIDGHTKKKLYVFEPEELKELVYLHAALIESLRLYPPAYINHRTVVKNDIFPDGKRVKAGMTSILSIYAVARMESVWGKDCREYKPERWIDEDGKFKSEMMSKFFIFNVGPRTCMGKEMAMNLMKSVFAAILFNFHVEVVEGKEDSLKQSIVLLMKNGLKVKVKERVH